MKNIFNILIKIIKGLFGISDKGKGDVNRPIPRPEPEPEPHPEPQPEPDPKPVDPKPDPEPTDPEPTDPEPTDPEPTDPEPTDPEPTDPEPTDPEPEPDPEPTDPNMMKLKVVRYSSGKHDTLGKFYINDKFYCYTLEDEHRESKVRGETRIPAGTYKVTLRTTGGFHATYTRKYKKMHKGMLWVRKVPNFEYILIHTGNTDKDTMGCLLVGEATSKESKVKSKRAITSSRKAYKKIYPIIANHLVAGGEVEITYVNEG